MAETLLTFEAHVVDSEDAKKEDMLKDAKDYKINLVYL